LPPRVQAIQNGHGNIKHDYVLPQFAGSAYQGATVKDDSNHIKLGFEKALAQFGYQFVIVGNENAGATGHSFYREDVFVRNRAIIAMSIVRALISPFDCDFQVHLFFVRYVRPKKRWRIWDKDDGFNSGRRELEPYDSE
jgi:hypothetical protein